MNDSNARAVLTGNIEALNQGLELLQALNDQQYVCVPEPYAQSSIAQHFRHVIDMFYALLNGVESQQVLDYDFRRRGTDIERCRKGCHEALAEVREWMSARLSSLNADDYARELTIQTEVRIEATESVQLSSTLLRELIFTSSHAIHHYALISVLAKIQGVSLSSNVGVAPATATFLRTHTDSKAAAVSEPVEVCAQ